MSNFRLRIDVAGKRITWGVYESGSKFEMKMRIDAARASVSRVSRGPYDIPRQDLLSDAHGSTLQVRVGAVAHHFALSI